MTVKSALSLVKNPIYHEKMKNIDVMLNFIRDIMKKRLPILKIDTEENSSGMLTKLFPIVKFKLCFDLIDIHKS